MVPPASSGLLTRAQPHLTLITAFSQFSIQRRLDPSLSPGRGISRVWTWNLPIFSQGFHPWPIFKHCSTSIPPENIRKPTSENLWFSDVFREYKRGILVENGLTSLYILDDALYMPYMPCILQRFTRLTWSFNMTVLLRWENHVKVIDITFWC